MIRPICRLIVMLIVTALIIPTRLSALWFALWQTSMGSFTAEMYDHLMPITTSNFI